MKFIIYKLYLSRFSCRGKWRRKRRSCLLYHHFLHQRQGKSLNSSRHGMEQLLGLSVYVCCLVFPMHILYISMMVPIKAASASELVTPPQKRRLVSSAKGTSPCGSTEEHSFCATMGRLYTYYEPGYSFLYSIDHMIHDVVLHRTMQSFFAHGSWVARFASF